jgi:hypothetical protein
MRVCAPGRMDYCSEKTLLPQGSGSQSGFETDIDPDPDPAIFMCHLVGKKA